MFKKMLLICSLTVTLLNAHDFSFDMMEVNSEDVKGKSRGFNFIYDKDLKFLNGKISLSFKAISGLEDQGGGIMYRVVDDNNYYVARYNPLEDNFRIYYVKDEVRSMMKSATLKLDGSKWHTMGLVIDGNHYRAYIDETLYLEGDDSTFTQAGGVGVWSKADAYTKFKNLVIE